MTASSRSDGQRRLRVAALLLSMALASSAMAQEGNEVSRLADEARQAFLSAEQSGVNAKQKAGFYQVARARVQLIEKFASQDASGSAELRDGARAELTRLADDGLSLDLLGSMLLQSSLGDLAGSQAADRVETGVALHQIASEQSSPAYRAAAFIEIGQAYSRAGAQDRALRYAALAMDTAGAIPDAGGQSGAYNAVVRLASALGPTGMTLANRAISLMPQARDRAAARHDIARDQLKGTPWEKAPDAKLKVEARRRLGTDDLTGGLQFVLALSDGDERDTLLSEVLTAAINRRDQDMALAAAQGMSGASRQQKALASLVKDHAGSDTPLRAAQIINNMQDGPAKISAQLALAAELKRAGYDDMAEQLFSPSLKAVEAMNEAAQRSLLPEVVRALTRANHFDEALRYAGRLNAGSDTSNVLGDLAKRLADEERVADAEALLPQIDGKNDRSHALSGIGRAKAKAGDAAAAMQVLPELADAGDAARVLSAVVHAHAQAGDLAQAISVAARIESPEDGIGAWTEIVRQANRKQDKEAGDRAVAEVIRIAEAQDGQSRARAFLALVTSLADAGNRTQASELKQRIGDDAMRSRAEGLIARADAEQAIQQKKSANLPDVLLKRSLDKVSNDEDKAEVALELAALPDGIIPATDLIRSIQDDRFRSTTFRKLAEARAGALMAPAKDEPTDDVGEVEAVAASSDEAGETDQEIQTRRGLTLIRTEAPPAAASRSQAQAPRHFAKADEVRAGTPWPTGAVAASTFADSNPYIARFLQDGMDGNARLEQAIRYQGLTSPRIIVVQSGVATLGMVARQLQGTDARDLIALDGDAVVVRAPIFVAPGATLILSRLDAPVYRLSADAGVFIANAGNLDIVDAQVLGYDEKAGQPAWADKDKTDLFRPFLLTWGDGRTNVASSVLTALGYDNSKSYGLTYSSGPDQVADMRDQASPTGTIVDNVFLNLYAGFQSLEAQNVQIVGNEYRDSIVYALDFHDRSKSLTVAFNTAYGTMLRHGITISREVDDNWLVGNLAFDNAGSGIVIDRNSTNNVLHANSSFHNQQDGVTLFESSCNILTSNHLVENKGDGLKIRNSFDVGAYSNRIEANVSSGVNAYVANLLGTKGGGNRNFDLDPYAPVTSLSLRRNRISANTVGIKADGVSGLAMFSNRFVRQSHRMFGGDVRGLEGQVLRLTSQSDVVIASTCRPAKPVVACRLRDQGFFEDGADLQVFNPKGGSDCTGVDGSVQHRAFSNSSQGT